MPAWRAGAFLCHARSSRRERATFWICFCAAIWVASSFNPAPHLQARSRSCRHKSEPLISALEIESRERRMRNGGEQGPGRLRLRRGENLGGRPLRGDTARALDEDAVAEEAQDVEVVGNEQIAHPQ